MEKLSLSDFCKEERIYSQLIQELFFHIGVKELYMVLMIHTAEKGDVYESVSYRNTYSRLEKRIPGVERMTVGDLLQYAVQNCLSGRDIETNYDETSIRLGHQIIKALLVDLFRPYVQKNQSTYESVVDKLKKAAVPPDDTVRK